MLGSGGQSVCPRVVVAMAKDSPQPHHHEEDDGHPSEGSKMMAKMWSHCEGYRGGDGRTVSLGSANA